MWPTGGVNTTRLITISRLRTHFHHRTWWLKNVTQRNFFSLRRSCRSHSGLHQPFARCRRTTQPTRQTSSSTLVTARISSLEAGQAQTCNPATVVGLAMFLLNTSQHKNYLEQQRSDRNFDARNEWIENGALVKLKGLEKQQGDRKQGDCYRWLSKKKCSKGDSCSFKQDMSKKGKGKGEHGRNRSPSPGPRSPRRSSEDGKGDSKRKSPEGNPSIW